MSDADLLWIRVDSGLHVGSGDTGAAVDLGIARDALTGFPFVPASTLKGVLRETERPQSAPSVAALGSNTDRGLLSLDDARIVAISTRSLVGHVAWLTSPLVLERMQVAIELAGLDRPDAVPHLSGDDALCDERSPLLIEGSLLLEGLRFVRRGPLPAGVGGLLEPCATSLGSPFDPAERLVVVSDRAFAFFARHAIPSATRVKLDYKTKNATDKHLFSEESLAPDTLFCSVARWPDRSPSKPSAKKTAQAQGWFRGLSDSILQIGAGRTSGAGVCEVTVQWKDA